MNSNLIGGFVRGFNSTIVVQSFLLSKKRVPMRRIDYARLGLSPDALYDRFMPLRSRLISGMIVVGICFVVGTYFALTGLNRLLAGSDGPASIRLFYQSAIWWFFPGFGAISLSWEITLQIWARFAGRETVNLFNDWSCQTDDFWGASKYSGMDTRKVLRWMSLLIVLPIGIATLLALNMHASVGPGVIRDCGYAFKACQVYPLEDAVRLTEIAGFRNRTGKVMRRTGVVVDFKDGRRWSSAEWGDWSSTVDSHLEDFLVNKTRLRLKYALTLDEIPPSGAPQSPTH
jgi:hypothetical protein